MVRQKALLIIGCGNTLQYDLEILQGHTFPVMAVNRAGISYPGDIAYWATYHEDDMASEDWSGQRIANGGNSDFKLITRDIVGSVVPSGSSVLLGTMYALNHFDRVVVAGTPLDRQYRGYRLGWECRRAELKGRVYALSGWLSQTFDKYVDHS